MVEVPGYARVGSVEIVPSGRNCIIQNVNDSMRLRVERADVSDLILALQRAYGIELVLSPQISPP